MTKKSLNIGVFLSANELEPKYTGPAKKFAKLLVKHNLGFVWGASKTGLMGVVADEIKAHGGKLIGITFEFLKDRAHPDTDELIVEETLSGRKKQFLERSDAFVVLIGGIGTLDEITEILELKKHGLHNKPIVILNTENFYEGLKVQLQKMKDDGFISPALDELIYFADTPEEVIEYLENKFK